jgi:hypothetical protein
VGPADHSDLPSPDKNAPAGTVISKVVLGGDTHERQSMKNKMMRLGLGAMVALAFAALPAVASAGEPEVTCGGAVCGAFTTHGGQATLATTSGTSVICTSNTGSGKYTTKTTGELNLTFSGCKDEVFGAACTTPGQASGFIKTGISVFHNIMIDSTAQAPPSGTAGVLITNPVGGVPYTTFNCLGFLHIEVSGNIIGHLESPACGSSSKEHKLVFANNGTLGHQKYMQVTTTGTLFDLTSKVNGGAPSTSSMDATGITTFASAALVTCP